MKQNKEMEALGRHLRSLREDFGLSMREVARRASVTPSYVSKLEGGGAFQSITVQGLKNFADIYHVPMQALMERAGFVEEDAEGLPGLMAYLKAKYRLPHQAAQEMEIAWEITKKKYLIS